MYDEKTKSILEARLATFWTYVTKLYYTNFFLNLLLFFLFWQSPWHGWNRLYSLYQRGRGGCWTLFQHSLLWGHFCLTFHNTFIIEEIRRRTVLAYCDLVLLQYHEFFVLLFLRTWEFLFEFTSQKSWHAALMLQWCKCFDIVSVNIKRSPSLVTSFHESKNMLQY